MGKRIGYGLGLFVQIWHPQVQLYTCYAHLDDVAESVPYFEPESHGDDCMPRTLNHAPSYLVKKSARVRRGDDIGVVGDTGLSWGYVELPRQRPDPGEYPSWDETHLHFEVYGRRKGDYRKEPRYDPFGIYGTAPDYATLRPAREGLWLLGPGDLPVFAS